MTCRTNRRRSPPRLPIEDEWAVRWEADREEELASMTALVIVWAAIIVAVGCLVWWAL